MILPCLLSDNVRQRGLVLFIEGFHLEKNGVGPITEGKGKTRQNMGLTGLEPVTLRLSSACSNQLSYRPGPRLRRGIFDLFSWRVPRGNYLNRQSQIANRKLKIACRVVARRVQIGKATSRLRQGSPAISL